MMFVFPDEQPRGFWMKHTRIPLDIVFLDAGGRVVSIHRMEPHDLQTTRSAAPAIPRPRIAAGYRRGRTDDSRHGHFSG